MGPAATHLPLGALVVPCLAQVPPAQDSCGDWLQPQQGASHSKLPVPLNTGGRRPPDPGFEPLHWAPFPSLPAWATLGAQRQAPPCLTKMGPRGPRHPSCSCSKAWHIPPPLNLCVHREAGGLRVSKGQGDHKRGGPETPASQQHALPLQTGPPNRWRSRLTDDSPLGQREPQTPDLDLGPELPRPEGPGLLVLASPELWSRQDTSSRGTMRPPETWACPSM